MAQAALPFETLAAPLVPTGAAAPGFTATPTAAAAGTAGQPHADAAGFEIGWDHAHHRLTPPLAHLHAASPIRQGWQAGRAVFGARALADTPAVRRWLALRLEAWAAGQPFEGVQVTPHFLARLAANTPECPVSRRPFMPATPAEGAFADDAVVTRLNPQAAYAAGNLVLLHRDVVQARGDLGAEAMLALAQRIDSGECIAVRGLDAAQWTRLAVLASFATPLSHARAACLPLRVLPGHRQRLLNPVQALQAVLTLQFGAAGYARRMLGISALMPSAEARHTFQIFMHTLLARRLSVGSQADGREPRDARDQRHAAEDIWADPLVQRRWQRLALRLDAADCERLLERAAQRGLVVGGGRWISAESATEGWSLTTPAAAAPDAGQPAAARRPAQSPGALPALSAGLPRSRPGIARSRGSQKPASCAGASRIGSPQ